MLPLFSVCQDSLVCLKRSLLVSVANRLDSFDIAKKEKYELLRYKSSCDSLIFKQADVIETQNLIMSNMNKEISFYTQAQTQQETLEKIMRENNKFLKEQNKTLTKKNKIYLAGGAILSIGLTAALIVSLFR
jgi:hypothetical protein